MSRTYDVAVVGAGPAGLAAAITTSGYGLATIVFDDSPSPGGQIYRAVTTTPVRRPELLGREYWRGADLVRPFRSSGAEYLPGTTVWGIERRPDGAFDLGVSGGRPGARIGGMFAARSLVVASGALERPLPFPGWTLPGVMTAGALQVLLKASALVPSGRVVLAGSGPLLWQVAWQLGNVGVPIDRVLETIPRGRLAEAMRHAPGFMFSGYLARGLELVRAVRRRTAVVEHVDALEASGAGRVQRVRYAVDGTWTERETDLLVLSHGVVANVNLPAALGCELVWNDDKFAYQPVADAWGGTSVESVFVAGDAAGIAGAEAAEARGRLAGLAVANALGRIDAATREAEAAKWSQALTHALRGRRFLDVLYRPAPAFLQPEGDTLVCRCEEVTAGAVRDAIRAGAASLHEVKAATRCAMGACQGRSCLATAAGLLAAELGRPAGAIAAPSIRFPLRPVTLAEIAAWPSRPEAEACVTRHHPPA
ncbi:MAG TPA: NAD(P)/FAD-dependent oxidoreductase [Casimicrobiaceae bacterium]|nr:NAD(P)/FAD-dependent oxidoreductase [Casimicrobiaceae bacterium]